jgi:hypothetical protein
MTLLLGSYWLSWKHDILVAIILEGAKYQILSRCDYKNLGYFQSSIGVSR